MCARHWLPAGDVTLTKEAGLLLQTTGVSSVTGEAFVNNRKRKLIPSYEITLQGSWKGAAPQIDHIWLVVWSCARYCPL